MVTFNVDSLDFVDDEEARFGADTDFATRFDSVNSRLELEDLTNSTVGYVPQDVGTDLVGGKFAETVSEGKALSDNGQVYNSIQAAVDNASSWVKVGPGDFRESVTIDTAGLTLEGSGERTKIIGEGGVITVDASEVTLSSFKLKIGEISVTSNGSDGSIINITGDVNASFFETFDGSNHQTGWSIINCTIDGADRTIGGVPDGLIIGNTITQTGGNETINVSGGTSTIVAHNVLTGEGTSDGIEVDSSDSIVYGNRIRNYDDGIFVSSGNDCIVAKNRLINAPLTDNGTGTILDSNLTT